MALMNNRAEPSRASVKRVATMSLAGVWSLSHSMIAQESRTRVFKLALPLLILKLALSFSKRG